MSQLEKLKREFENCTGPFEYKKLVRLLIGLGYICSNGDGSRKRFVHETTRRIIRIHSPHPGTEVLPYVVRQVRDTLKDNKEL